jgi:hypothetical protein
VNSNVPAPAAAMRAAPSSHSGSPSLLLGAESTARSRTGDRSMILPASLHASQPSGSRVPDRRAIVADVWEAALRRTGR